MASERREVDIGGFAYFLACALIGILFGIAVSLAKIADRPECAPPPAAGGGT